MENMTTKEISAIILFVVLLVGAAVIMLIDFFAFKYVTQSEMKRGVSRQRAYFTARTVCDAVGIAGQLRIIRQKWTSKN